MTVANWITLLVPIIGLIVAGLLYVIQKFLDRQHELHRERRELYRGFVRSYVDLSQLIRIASDSKAALSKLIELNRILGELAVTAPDSVVLAYGDIGQKMALAALKAFEKEKSETEENSENKPLNEAEILYNSTVSAMRRDSFENTTIAMNTLSKILLRSVGELLP